MLVKQHKETHRVAASLKKKRRKMLTTSDTSFTIHYIRVNLINKYIGSVKRIYREVPIRITNHYNIYFIVAVLKGCFSKTKVNAREFIIMFDEGGERAAPETHQIPDHDTKKISKR